MWRRSIGFEIKELLGEGGQGSVYRGLRRDPATGLSQTVAVKILHSETAVGAWKSEFESLAKVRSEYCVQVYGFERVNQRPALILEFVDGVSLSTLGRGCWLDENEIREILAQIECAILDLYKYGSFHGDLSPNNILIDNAGRIRVLDFGMANSSAEFTRATPDFASPERLCGERADLASDIFSLGRIEQFLRGQEPGPDPNSPYLHPVPAKRALRGEFPTEARRLLLAAKVRDFRRRQSLAQKCRTRTQILKRALTPPAFATRVAIATTLLFISTSGLTSVTPRFASLNIRTHKWHRFKLDGRAIGYSPLQIPLATGRTHRLEWESDRGRGEIALDTATAAELRLTDRDFSH